MTTTDWLIDIALILIVVRQLREEKLTKRFVIVPAAIVFFVAHSYLHGLPNGAASLTLVAVAIAVGATLGLAGGLLTRVRGENGGAYVQAGPAAAGVWVGSMTARLGFIIWITHSGGEQALAHFSAAHGITDANTWQTALVLLALAEVVTRIATVVVRGALAAQASHAPAALPRPAIELVSR